ncbi:hypothetical protein E2562_033784 [Oryza meyeriana var. granulata]|uniref:Uncharacterized protein n=1 Tax=Oryza meyeriana var. granulata TaxID=110450 RepID=A0A6G1C1Z9_9ORYZ|nr:hypothetical protein E2562_033784 [Oryza meyeriana var. granulata]
MCCRDRADSTYEYEEEDRDVAVCIAKQSSRGATCPAQRSNSAAVSSIILLRPLFRVVSSACHLVDLFARANKTSRSPAIRRWPV